MLNSRLPVHVHTCTSTHACTLVHILSSPHPPVTQSSYAVLSSWRPREEEALRLVWAAHRDSKTNTSGKENQAYSN